MYNNKIIKYLLDSNNKKFSYHFFFIKPKNIKIKKNL